MNLHENFKEQCKIGHKVIIIGFGVNQWRIKGDADWATARGPQDLGGPQSLSR